MSEKEIRETLEVLYRDFYVEEVGFDDMTASAVYGALETEPDVVGLAKQLIETSLLVDEFGDEWITLERASLEEILAEQFHIRFTDGGGWEYVEKGTIDLRKAGTMTWDELWAGVDDEGEGQE